jgi:hypothetical protein
MAKTIGRLGYLGLALESSPGSANTTPSVFIPYTDISLRGHHEPIEVIGSTASRFVQRTSVVGKKWSEGDVAMDLDSVVSGYLLKMAFGNEILTTGTPNIHNFFVTASGNTPKTATLIFGRDTDVEQYAYSSLNELTIEVSDGLATMSASVMGDFPSTGSVQTPTVTSGTVFAFPNMELRFGGDLTTAAGNSDTTVSEMSLTMSNEVEVIHQSGQSNPVAIRTKGFNATANYSVFFETETEKNEYYNLNKKAMEVKFNGIANEDLKFRMPRIRLNEAEVSTGIDDFFIVDTEVVVEDQVGGGGSLDAGVRFMDAVLRNSKSTVYA